MANHYWIRRVPELTLADLADRLDKRLAPPLKCSAFQPALWLSPGLVVHGGGRAGTTVQLRQGPQATVLSINRRLLNMPLWMRFMPPILRYVLFMGDDSGAWAAVRSFVLESGEFVGPDGGKPRRLFRPGRIWMLGNPALFQLIGTFKLLVGLGVVGFCLYVCAGYDDALPIMAIVAALAGRWIYTGIANLRLRMGSFLVSLLPLVLTGAVAYAVGSASPPIRHHFDAVHQEADLAAQRQKVLAGGPVRDYAWHVNGALYKSRDMRGDPESTAKLGAQLVEALKIMVQRNVFLHDVHGMIENSHLPNIDQAKRTNDERIKKIRDLIDRKYDPEARAMETAVRSHNYALDESGTPHGEYGKYHVVVRPPDRDAERQVVEYLERHNIRVQSEWVFNEYHFTDRTEIGVPNDCDPAKVKGLLALNAPKADAEPQWAELDRKEVVLHTDDPESPYVIVPAQYVRSLAGQLGHSQDLKWDEALYRRGKICVQFPSLDSGWYDSFRHDLEAWKPVANISDSTSYPWP